MKFCGKSCFLSHSIIWLVILWSWVFILKVLSMVHYYRFTLEFMVTDISIAFECLNQYSNAVNTNLGFSQPLNRHSFLDILLFLLFLLWPNKMTEKEKKNTQYVLSRQRCLILNMPVIFFNTDQMSRARISKYSIHIYSTCVVLDICVLGIAQHHFNTFLCLFSSISLFLYVIVFNSC